MTNNRLPIAHFRRNGNFEKNGKKWDFEKLIKSGNFNEKRVVLPKA